MSACEADASERQDVDEGTAAVLTHRPSVSQAFDESELLECIRRLVEVEQDWAFVAGSPSQLYIRPTFISTEVLTLTPVPLPACGFLFPLVKR